MAFMSSGVQRYPRTRMVLPLRVWVGEAADESAQQLAHTIDISPIGGRLGGLRNELQPGQTITLQRGQQKAPFRVVWNKSLAPGENQAGIEAVGADRNIWGVELPASTPRQSLRERLATPDPASTLQPLAASATASNQQPSGSVKKKNKLIKSILGASGLLAFLLSAAWSWHSLTSSRVAVHVPAPEPPTAAELAKITPRARLTPLSDEVTTWHSAPVPRVSVTEAPTQRMVYPVSPNTSLSGKVDLNVLIATDGRVKQVHVVSGKQPFVQAAEQAARQWRYSPYAVKGEPAEGESKVIVAFRGGDAVSLEFPAGGASQQKLIR